MTTYPRSDCRYLPEEQFADAGRILGVLATISEFAAMASAANSVHKSAAWDTSKITAHHGIIPTGEVPQGLSVKEKQLYGMIATAYALQFHLDYRYESQKITVDLQGTAWAATGRVVIEPGWTRFAREEDESDAKEKEQRLTAARQGDAVNCAAVDRLDKKTTPPPKFTEGSLIEAMANVH